MKPLGKTMKIAHYNHEDEKKALQNLLENYRDTPHPATGVPPAAMLFRDSISNTFPRKSVADDVIHAARANDATQKLEYQEKANSSKYKKPADVSVCSGLVCNNPLCGCKAHSAGLVPKCTQCVCKTQGTPS